MLEKKERWADAKEILERNKNRLQGLATEKKKV